MKTVVAVLGYGCNLSADMKEYLDKALSFIKKKEVDLVICCGGKTNRRTAPGISESSVMVAYLKPKISTEIHYEEISTTTAKNLEQIKQIKIFRGFSEHHLVIFCNEAHKCKVNYLSKRILGFSPELITHDLTKSFVKKTFQLFVASPLSIAAHHFPGTFGKMEKLFRERKMNRS
jgi:hypothetical protein